MANILRDDKLTKVAHSVKLDAKRRVVLPKALATGDVTYHIYVNRIGQIVLDPQVTVAASEAWLFEDKAALASVDKGMAESVGRRVVNRGSFAKYIKDAL